MWKVATPPVMAPGFIAPGPEIVAWRLSNEIDNLLLEVDVAAQNFPGARWPAGVRNGWRRVLGSDGFEEVYPSGARPVAAVIVRVRAELKPPELPEDVLGNDERFWRAAEETCDVLVAQANAALAPVLEALRQ